MSDDDRTAADMATELVLVYDLLTSAVLLVTASLTRQSLPLSDQFAFWKNWRDLDRLYSDDPEDGVLEDWVWNYDDVLTREGLVFVKRRQKYERLRRQLMGEKDPEIEPDAMTAAELEADRKRHT